MRFDQIAGRRPRRSILKMGTLGVAAAAFLAACGDDDDDGGNTAPSGGTGGSAAGSPPASGGSELKLIQGWYKGRDVKYYDFGMNTKLASGNSIGTAPIYVMTTGNDASGNPRLVQGQGNIVAVKPGDAGYSDLWRVMMVTVPSSYKANDLKNASDVMSSGFGITETSMFVNCPIVARGTTLEGGEKLVQGWYKNEEAFYPDFGANPPAAIPIWVMITGVDASGNPQMVSGQRNIIDSVPSDPGYSAFWRVNLVKVNPGYQANSLKSAADVRSSGLEVMQADLVVNCPVTTVA